MQKAVSRNNPLSDSEVRDRAARTCGKKEYHLNTTAQQKHETLAFCLVAMGEQ